MTGEAREVDVLIVGAGPAGLAAGAELAAATAGRVEILEREQEAGGIPRHCHHGGFGGRLDRSAYAWASAAGSAYARRGTTGPDFARRGVAAAVAAGAALRTGVTVTGWAGPRTVETTGPAGLERITARAVILATGARERPRSARLIPGARPPGVYTTGELQQAVHLYGQRIGTTAVVVGDEPVGHAAVATLRAMRRPCRRHGHRPDGPRPPAAEPARPVAHRCHRHRTHRQGASVRGGTAPRGRPYDHPALRHRGPDR